MDVKYKMSFNNYTVGKYHRLVYICLTYDFVSNHVTKFKYKILNEKTKTIVSTFYENGSAYLKIKPNIST